MDEIKVLQAAGVGVGHWESNLGPHDARLGSHHWVYPWVTVSFAFWDTVSQSGPLDFELITCCFRQDLTRQSSCLSIPIGWKTGLRKLVSGWLSKLLSLPNFSVMERLFSLHGKWKGKWDCIRSTIQGVANPKSRERELSETFWAYARTFHTSAHSLRGCETRPLHRLTVPTAAFCLGALEMMPVSFMGFLFSLCPFSN